MPYCTQCGNRVGAADLYCAACGARQAAAPHASEPLSGISPRSASLVCYIPLVGWIASIIVLASARFREDRNVRFHAFQGLYIFVAWLIVDWVLDPVLRIPGLRFKLGELLKLGLFAVWVFMMVKVSQDQTVKLPVVGELAEKSVSEQR